jgi:hypothetical protein
LWGPLDDFLVTDSILQRIADQAALDIEVPEFLDDAVTSLIQPIVDQTLERVRQGIGQIIASDPFARSWRQIVADTHRNSAAFLPETTTSQAKMPPSTFALSSTAFKPGSWSKVLISLPVSPCQTSESRS